MADTTTHKAERNRAELLILLRAEQNALVGLLIKKCLITESEFQEELVEEARKLSRDYEQLFPGFSVGEFGPQMKMPEAGKTTESWPKPD